MWNDHEKIESMGCIHNKNISAAKKRNFENAHLIKFKTNDTNIIIIIIIIISYHYVILLLHCYY